MGYLKSSASHQQVLCVALSECDRTCEGDEHNRSLPEGTCVPHAVDKPCVLQLSLGVHNAVSCMAQPHAHDLAYARALARLFLVQLSSPEGSVHSKVTNVETPAVFETCKKQGILLRLFNIEQISSASVLSFPRQLNLVPGNCIS